MMLSMCAAEQICMCAKAALALSYQIMAYHDNCPQKRKNAMSSWPNDGDSEVAAVRWMWQYCALLSWGKPLYACRVRKKVENQYFWSCILRSQFWWTWILQIHESSRLTPCPRFSRTRHWFSVEFLQCSVVVCASFMNASMILVCRGFMIYPWPVVFISFANWM